MGYISEKDNFLEAISDFAQALFEAETINDIVWAVTNQAISKLNYEDCIIYLYDKEKGLLVQQAAFGSKQNEGEITNPIYIEPGRGIVGTVFSRGKPEIIRDTREDARYIVDDDYRLSEITVPIIYKDRVIGIIDSEHSQLGFFDEKDLKILSAIASMASIKIAETETKAVLREHKDNLESIVKKKTAELEEKNKVQKIILKELQHRVKNNLQLISSLIQIKLNNSIDEVEKKTLFEVKSRINSFALVHEKMFRSKDSLEAEIDSFIIELAENILHSYGKSDSIEINYDIYPFKVDLDIAIPLSLITNELITNSIKHAFPYGEKGKIYLKISSCDEHLRYEYWNSGKNFKPNEFPDSNTGIAIINSLIEQVALERFDSNEKYFFKVKI